MLNMQKLREAERMLSALMKDTDRWQGRADFENGKGVVSIWRPFGEQTAYHVVLQFINKHFLRDFKLAEQAYCLRVAKGVLQLCIGAELEEDTTSGMKVRFAPEADMVLAAGSQYMNHDRDTWETLTPITDEVLLLRVCYAEREPPYAEGTDNVGLKQIDWMLRQFAAVYGGQSND